MNVKQALGDTFEGEVVTTSPDLEPYSRDASLFEVIPSAAVKPKHTQDVQALVKFAAEHANEGVSLTARSGGTCMSGGPLTQSIVVDMQAHMNTMKAIKGTSATVQPGAWYRDFEKATLQRDLLMPSYPASKSLCTVGGMVNNNAGGEKTLAYGKTDKYIEQLKVVLRDGNEYTLKPLTPDELETKKQQQTLEGQIYRDMHELLDNNYAAIQDARPNVTKNSSGYALWDVWDKKTFNLCRLFAGSQGTLGITTEITFRLIHPKKHSAMLVMFLRDIDNLADIIRAVMRFKPESFESYDDNTLAVALKLLPQMVKKMGASNTLSLALQFFPELKLILTGGLPRLVLIAEFTGDTEEEPRAQAKAAHAAVQQFQIASRITKNAKESQKYWTIRRESFSLLRNNVRDKHTAPFIDDMAVQPDQLPQFLPRLNEILGTYDLTYTIAGHVGDANFHIIPLMNLSDSAQRDIIPKLAKEVYNLVFEFDGTITGEHNDGLIRSPFVKDMFGEDIYNLFVQTKHIFDPHNIFNPGKKVDADFDFAMNHLIHE